jgi:hypothetical protein
MVRRLAHLTLPPHPDHNSQLLRPSCRRPPLQSLLIADGWASAGALGSTPAPATLAPFGEDSGIMSAQATAEPALQLAAWEERQPPPAPLAALYPGSLEGRPAHKVRR